MSSVECFLTQFGQHSDMLELRHHNSIEALVQKVYEVTHSSHLIQESNNIRMEECLYSIAKMYKVAPEKRPFLDELKERISIAKTWVDLRLEPSFLESDFESVRFLVKQRLIFSIIGLRNTSSLGQKQMWVEAGKLFVFLEGKSVPVVTLVDRFQYVKEDLQYREHGTNLPWNYVLPHGFVQIDRCETPELVPTTRLLPEEMRQVFQHAAQFQGLAFSKEDPPVAVVQISTNFRKLIRSDCTLFDGIEALAPVHVGIRVVDQRGWVYSTGFASSGEEDKKCEGLSNFLVTINGVPGITDYEEFRTHEGRRVTSVPLSSQTCLKVMSTLRSMRVQGMRFNIMSQNCTRMASRILEDAGVFVDHRVTVGQYFRLLFPVKQDQRQVVVSPKAGSFLQEPLFGLGKRVPMAVGAAASNRSIGHCFCNLFFAGFGACQGSPMKARMFGEKPDDRVRAFSAIITSTDSLFEAPLLYHSGPVIFWQDQQATTLYYTYREPCMNVLPGGGSTVPAQARRPYERFRFCKVCKTNS